MFLRILQNISTFVTPTLRDLIMLRSSSFAPINGAIYFQLLVVNFLNSAFCEKKSKYLNCFLSCSFSFPASFWFAFKNRLPNHCLFNYGRQDGEQ